MSTVEPIRTLPTLTPGIYENIAAEIYHVLPYFSNSRGTKLKRSPAHLRADMDNPGEATDAMRLGTAIHHAVLEPDDFTRLYVMAGQCVAELKSGARKGQQCGNTGRECHGGEWYCGQHAQAGEPDRVVALSPTDYASCIGVRDSVYSNPRLRTLLDAPGRTELTVIWQDEETGVMCKARIDKDVEAYGGVIFDLKSTTDARVLAFERKLFEMGYFRQSGFYRDGLAAHGVIRKHMVIAAAEKVSPYAVAGYRLTDIVTQAGSDDMRALLRRYAECERSNNWPAYDEKINEISLPNWAWNQLEEIAA